MTNDISIEARAAGASVAAMTFDEFYRANVESIGTGLLLATDDLRTAGEALQFAMARSAQRWRSLEQHANNQGWAFGQGIENVHALNRKQVPGDPRNAPADTLHGLDLADAYAALPLLQRAVLIAAYWFGWSDEHIAAGFEVPTSAIHTRRQRALWFIGQHLGLASCDVERVVIEFLGAASAGRQVGVPDVGSVRSRGRRRQLRLGVTAIGLILAVIAMLAAVLDLSTRGSPEVAVSKPVDPPTSAPGSFAPVHDGRGGFIALDASGGARFATSVDGIEWFRAALWNFRRIDVRTMVTGFERSGERYVATLEAPSSTSGLVAPRVAVSDDLVDWDVRRIEVGELPSIEGLIPAASVSSVAIAGAHVLAAVIVEDEIDYRALGVAPTDVCVVGEEAAGLTLHLCDGGEVRVANPRAGSSGDGATRFYLSEADAAGFEEVKPPKGFDPYGLFSSGGEFAMLDGATSEIQASADGRTWRSVYSPETPNRFGLAAGSPADGIMVIAPAEAGWRSTLIRNGEQRHGELGLDLAPASVWIKPVLAYGPAGWAVLVTTSRPWEQTALTPGWAIEAGEWVVSRLPDSTVITASSTREDLTYRFLRPAETPGALTLTRPGTAEVLVTISDRDIADSAAVVVDDVEVVKARLFFSEDGRTWRVLWETNLNIWGGSVAVGDDEVLVSGTQLGGAPISIPLDR